jgi:hypothetical protein
LLISGCILIRLGFLVHRQQARVYIIGWLGVMVRDCLVLGVK